MVQNKHLPLKQLPDFRQEINDWMFNRHLEPHIWKQKSYFWFLSSPYLFSLYLFSQIWCDYLILWQKPWRQCYHLSSSHASHLVHLMAGCLQNNGSLCNTSEILLITSTILRNHHPDALSSASALSNSILNYTALLWPHLSISDTLQKLYLISINSCSNYSKGFWSHLD